MKKVTVIIPNYNGIEYIEGCLNSLKTQTFSDFDILLVDNASTDDVKITEESVSYSIDWNGEESYEKSQESDEESRELFDKIDDFIEKLIEKKDSLCEKYSKAKKKYRYWSSI